MAIEDLWGTFREAITAYTGLSPAAFFTVAAAAIAVYYMISGFFQPPAQGSPRDFVPPPPLPPPVQLGEITAEELKSYDGSDPQKPLLMAIKGQIYDVSQSRMFYGPGGPYALFAGKDASRALAKMSFEEKDLTGDVEGLGAFELDALQDWEYKFKSKYIKVGTVKKPEVTKDESAGNTSGATEPVAHVTENSAVPEPEKDESVDNISEVTEPSVAHAKEDPDGEADSSTNENVNPVEPMPEKKGTSED